MYTLYVWALLIVATSSQKTFRQSVLLNKTRGEYDRHTPPFELFKKPTTLNMNIAAVSLLDVPDLRNTVEYYITFIKNWVDPRLHFDEATFGPKVVTTTDQLWIPRTGCGNCIDAKKLEEQEQITAVVVPNGTVYTLWKVKLDTVCENSTGRFPFVVKHCFIYFNREMGPYGLLNSTKEVLAEDVHGISEWQLYAAKTVRASGDVIFNFILTRNWTFYLYAVMAPAVLATAVCIVLLWLPKDNGLNKKAMVSSGGMLSLSIILGVLWANVPKTADMPSLGTILVLHMSLVLGPLIFHKVLEWLKERLRNWISGQVINRIGFTISELMCFGGPVLIYTAPPLDEIIGWLASLFSQDVDSIPTLSCTSSASNRPCMTYVSYGQ